MCPRVEHRHARFDEFVDIARNHDQILQSGDGRNEEVWLPERVAALAAFDNHRLPSNYHVFSDRKNPSSE
jgi:hypothetical protein